MAEDGGDVSQKHGCPVTAVLLLRQKSVYDHQHGKTYRGLQSAEQHVPPPRCYHPACKGMTADLIEHASDDLFGNILVQQSIIKGMSTDREIIDVHHRIIPYLRNRFVKELPQKSVRVLDIK